MEKIPRRIQILAKAIYDTLEEDNPWFSKVDDKEWREVDQIVKDFYYEMAKLALKAVESMQSEMEENA